MDEGKKIIGTMNIILICMGVFLACYTAVMIYLYVKRGSYPIELTQEVFKACVSEAGFMGAIKVLGKDVLQFVTTNASKLIDKKVNAPIEREVIK